MPGDPWPWMKIWSPPPVVVLAAEEVVEADLVEAGRGLVGGDVAADLEALAVGRGHHHRGVPADERADAALGLLVTGEPRLALRGDGVDVVGGAQRGHADLLLAGALQQAQHHVAGPVAAAVVEHRVEGREPLLRLVGIDVGQLGRKALVDHRHVGRGCSLDVGLLGVTHRLIVSRMSAPRNLPIGSPVERASRTSPASHRGPPDGAGVAAHPVFGWTMGHLSGKTAR